MPLFSIVIPVFNRRREVARAVASVLAQDLTDFEVVVVDDGSTDGANADIETIADERVRLLRFENNRGVCPARNAGVDHARGDWIVFLDSDDELVPGALQQLRRRISESPPGVERIAGVYRWDDGSLSPEPFPADQILDYRGYIRWTEHLKRSDFHNTIRRRTFETVRLPDGRAYEGIYHLDFQRHFHTWLIPDVVALEHQDAANRAANLSLPTKAARILRDAPDGLWAEERIIAEHGRALQQYSRTSWEQHHRIRVLFAFLAGERAKGCQYARQYIHEFGCDYRVVVAAAIGTLGQKPLAWAFALRQVHA